VTPSQPVQGLVEASLPSQRERRDRALDAASDAYLALAWEVRERLPAPEDLMADQ
jgi:hypothetical protein